MAVPAIAAALLPLVLQYAPQLAGHLFGPRASDVADEVVATVGAIAGTREPDEVAAVLAADPAKGAELARDLAEIAAREETARMQAVLADVQHARATHRMHWMPAVVTAVLLALFGAVMWVVLVGAIPADNQRLADQLIGGLYTLVTTAVAYWVGTSRGAVEMRQTLQDRAGPFAGGPGR